ncbi:MAG: hypothetical protein ACT4OM_05725 [Actinomycetota bacterium]
MNHKKSPPDSRRKKKRLFVRALRALALLGVLAVAGKYLSDPDLGAARRDKITGLLKDLRG